VNSAKIYSVSQVQLKIQAATEGATFDAVREELLHWVNRKAGRPLPKAAWRGESFEMYREVGCQPVAASTLAVPRLWACRVDDADKQVPQRTWTTEIGLGERTDGAILLGCRLFCVTMGADLPFEPSVPSFVRRLADRFEVMLDGVRVREIVHQTNDEDSIRRLLVLLVDRSRRYPVIAVSTGKRVSPTTGPSPIPWTRG
jgi:hypothetical protein